MKNLSGVKARITKINHDILKHIPFTAANSFIKVYPRINPIQGFLTSGQEEWMFTMARRLPPSANILEIGCYLGRSTASFALACLGTSKRVYSIDIFGGLYQDVINNADLRESFCSDFFEKWRINMIHAGVIDYVFPLKGDSKNIAQIWRAPVHLLFIDGSHTYDDTVADFNNFFTHIVPGGIVALHDVLPGWPGVYKAWHEVIKHHLIRIDYCDSICYGVKPK